MWEIRSLLPAVIVLVPYDIILFEIFPELHLDDFKGDYAGIPEPVPDPAPHKRTLSLPEQFCLAIEYDFCGPFHYHPMLAPVVVKLDREFLSGLYRETLDLVPFYILKDSIGSPW